MYSHIWPLLLLFLGHAKALATLSHPPPPLFFCVLFEEEKSRLQYLYILLKLMRGTFWETRSLRLVFSRCRSSMYFLPFLFSLRVSSFALHCCSMPDEICNLNQVLPFSTGQKCRHTSKITLVWFPSWMQRGDPCSVHHSQNHSLSFSVHVTFQGNFLSWHHSSA